MATGIEMTGLTVQEARRIGKELRDTVGRSAHARFEPPSDRDPVATLEQQNAQRLPGLVPVRMGRMLQSPFTYYRGSAAVMANDLASEPRTGAQVVACGDAHVSNFGLFASPERRVLFDLNDFDEAGPAPWEWDVKRLAGSLVVGFRDNGFDDARAADAVRDAVRRYRETLAMLIGRTAIERYFFQVESDWLQERAREEARDLVRRSARKARRRTSDRVLERVTVRDGDGAPRIVDQPPIMTHVDHADDEAVDDMFHRYRSTLRADSALLLSQFRVADHAMRIVGVGSVGTRCYIILLVGPDGEALFLQAKEAPPTVLETYGGIPYVPPPGICGDERSREGHRVVSCQRILQAQSDPFLGWINEGGRDYYWRQFRDMKGSIELGELTAGQFEAYGGLCARLLARAHSQSPGAALISGYLGRSDRFDRAIATWALACADQAERDHELLRREVRNGRLPAVDGV